MTEYIRASLGWFLFWFAPIVVAAVTLYFLVTIPARRNERARLFLNLLLGGIRAGRAPEEIIVAVSRTRDTSIGPKLHLVAAYIEEGYRLVAALERVPGLLPPHVIGFLRAGMETNRMPEALDAAIGSMVRGFSGRESTAVQYAFVLLIMMFPFAAILLPLLSIFVWPKMEQIMGDMEVPIPPISAFVMHHGSWTFLIYAAITLLAALLMARSLSSPRGAGNERGIFAPVWFVLDRFIYWLPGKRALLQRDFSLVLALLLDAEVPEAKALAMAGESTGNRYLASKANRTVRRMQSGLPLTKAVAAFDKAGELQWRLANASKGQGGFVNALRGWHNALENEAFKHEQAAAHLSTTGLLVLNGVFVGVIAAAIFLIFISVISEGLAG